MSEAACAGCGQPFTPKREHGVYCSPRCRVAAWRRSRPLPTMAPVPVRTGTEGSLLPERPLSRPATVTVSYEAEVFYDTEVLEEPVIEVQANDVQADAIEDPAPAQPPPPEPMPAAPVQAAAPEPLTCPHDSRYGPASCAYCQVAIAAALQAAAAAAAQGRT